jgi:S-adenosylmethionine:tRNA ribosyltransferase-isomerase
MKNKGNLIKNVDLKDYQYHLPEEKIAVHPLANRSDSRLLLYRSGEIGHHFFSDIADLMPKDSILVFNNTKVIPARLHFQKSTGSAIEVFLLHPEPSRLPVNESMTALSPVTWSCMIGNKKRWKGGDKLARTVRNKDEVILFEAEWADRENDLVRFSWSSGKLTFSEVITASGNVPLPPYIKRPPVMEDSIRYQTVYSEKEGAVAAPTAGLHFTEEILEEVKAKGLAIDYLTLHVSAGTFQPIKNDDVLEHPMHREQILITSENLDNFCSARKFIAVGTTSLRSLESLYWFGVKILLENDTRFVIEKLLPYSYDPLELPSRDEAFAAVQKWMAETGKKEIIGETEVFIIPGYDFKVCEGLVTNFHMPCTTLILLVAAFVGDSWKKIYDQALKNNYRFLSYGDSSLLLK